MQPVRLGALVLFCASAVLLVSLVLPPSRGAQQAVLEREDVALSGQEDLDRVGQGGAKA